MLWLKRPALKGSGVYATAVPLSICASFAPQNWYFEEWAVAFKNKVHEQLTLVSLIMALINIDSSR